MSAVPPVHGMLAYYTYSGSRTNGSRPRLATARTAIDGKPGHYHIVVHNCPQDDVMSRGLPMDEIKLGVPVYRALHLVPQGCVEFCVMIKPEEIEPVA